MDLEKHNGENPKELESAACEEAPLQETEEELVVEVVMEEEPSRQSEEALCQQEVTPEKKTCIWAERAAALKEKIAALMTKKKGTEEAPACQEQEIPEAEETEAPVMEEEPAEPAPVRRKPADAFAIDFPLEGEEEKQKQEPEQEQPEEETQQTEDLFAGEPEEVTAAPAKKPMKPLTLGLLLGGCVVLLGLLAFFVVKGAGVQIGPRTNDVYYKSSYTADDAALAKKADTVVATIGDRKLTVSELQLYYINSIYTFYSQNYYYLSMMNLDLSAPLDTQYYPGEENMTWEQFFLDAALKSWQSYTIVEIMAEQDGFTVSPEMQAQIDSMPQQLEEIAAAYGYESAEDYLNEEMTPGLSTDIYVNFNWVYCVSNEYISNFYQEQYPDSEDITLYYEENKEVFTANGITRDIGLISDVRHILIQPQGGETDESGTTTYSEDEWATALSEAEKILNQWKEGEATEESFAALANTYSADGGSNTTGGLYEDIHIDSSYVPEFKNWAIDASRKPGDTGIVQTTYGYHIMYFVDGENYFEYVVGEQLVAQRIQDKTTEVMEAFPMEVSYKKILLCEEPLA